MNKLERFLPYLNIFIRHWIAICLSALILGIIFFGVGKFLIKPTYAANTILYCGRIAQETQPRSNLSNEYYLSLNVGLNLIADYRELMDSARIQKHVNQKLVDILVGRAPVPGDSADSDKSNADASAKGEGMQETIPVKIGNNAGERNEHISLDKLRESCYQVKTGTIYLPPHKKIVSSTAKTRLLSITVECSDPQAAALIANVYADVFVDEIKNIMQMSNSQIIDYAGVPISPIRPHWVVNTVIGFLLGGILSYAFFLLSMYLDMTVKSAEEATKLFHLPMIGTIPEREELDVDKLEKGTTKIATFEKSPEMISLAECFRAARANLQYDNFGKKGAGKIVMVTSTVPSEGKSMCIANFAAAMAEAGKRVLLLDMDLRKPTQHKIFCMKKKTGLVNYLVGECALDEVITKRVMDRSLDVLFCGPIPPNPSNLLVSDKMDSLLEQARKDYDFIFIDAPPVTAAADAIILGGKADGVLYVMRACYTRSNQITSAITSLKQAKINVLGIVLNRLPEMTRAGYGYGYRYRYGYGYGYGYKYKQKQAETEKAAGEEKKADKA